MPVNFRLKLIRHAFAVLNGMLWTVLRFGKKIYIKFILISNQMYKDDNYNALLKEYNLQDDIFHKASRPIVCRILRAANVWSVQVKDKALIERLLRENTKIVKIPEKWNGISLNETA